MYSGVDGRGVRDGVKEEGEEKRLVNGSGLSAIPGTCTLCAAPREGPRLYNMLLRGETTGGEGEDGEERRKGKKKCDEVEGCRWIAGLERKRDICAGSDRNGSDHTKTYVLAYL